MADPTSIAKTEGAPPVPARDDHEDRDLDNVVGDSKSLAEDISEWLRLKIQLIQIEVHERVTKELNAILSSVLVLGLMLVAILLGMMALGLLIGELVGSVAVGFVCAALLVALAGVLIGRSQPQWIGDIMYFLVPRRWIKEFTRNDDEPRED